MTQAVADSVSSLLALVRYSRFRIFFFQLIKTMRCSLLCVDGVVASGWR